MGAGADVNAFFGIMTGVIAIPTGVKMFNWIFTMFRGRILFTSPMHWFLGFVVTFTIGGMSGVLLSIPAADFELHNSLFLVAHFHNMIVGGVLFGYFAGLTYWFPKIWGFTLDEKLGIYAFWFWIIGFMVAFVPLYILGLMGATRRLDHYDASTGWQSLFIVAGVGVVIIIIGVMFQALQVLKSIRDRKRNHDKTGDPWNGRTLEWSVSSPAPFYNFAVIPTVHGHDPWWARKQSVTSAPKLVYEDFEMPKNSPIGLVCGAFAFILGFALIWQIMWLVPIAAIGILASILVRSFDDDLEYTVTAAEVEHLESHHQHSV